MAIDLPLAPRPDDARMELIWAGNDVPSPLGGSTQRINRLGDRFALTISLPALKLQACGGVWQSRLDRAKSEEVIYALPKQLLRRGSSGASGAPVVNGAAAGMVLPVRGLAAGFALVDDQPLSIIVGGRRYVHRVASDVVADGAGVVALSIYPMLRVTVPDGAVIEIDAPKIQGLITGGGTDTNRFGFNSFDTFTITENR